MPTFCFVCCCNLQMKIHTSSAFFNICPFLIPMLTDPLSYTRQVGMSNQKRGSFVQSRQEMMAEASRSGKEEKPRSPMPTRSIKDRLVCFQTSARLDVFNRLHCAKRFVIFLAVFCFCFLSFVFCFVYVCIYVCVCSYVFRPSFNQKATRAMTPQKKAAARTQT